MKATYDSVRRHLGRHFPLSRTSTGRRSGQRWTEGVQVRTSNIHGVVVDYTESHASRSDGSPRTAQLAEVRSRLEERFTVIPHPYGDGRLIVRTR